MKLLTKREKNLLDHLLTSITVKDAAYFIRTSNNPNTRDERMTDDAAYQMLHRIREKQRDARNFINFLLQYRRKKPLLEQVLTPREKMKLDEAEEDE